MHNFRYNGKKITGDHSFISDLSTVILGYAVIRQKRVLGNRCIQRSNLPVLKECYSDYSGYNEEKLDFNLNWTRTNNESLINSVTMAYKYNSSSILKDNPYFGVYTNYMGGKGNKCF